MDEHKSRESKIGRGDGVMGKYIECRKQRQFIELEIEIVPLLEMASCLLPASIETDLVITYFIVALQCMI